MSCWANTGRLNKDAASIVTGKVNFFFTATSCISNAETRHVSLPVQGSGFARNRACRIHASLNRKMTPGRKDLAPGRLFALIEYIWRYRQEPSTPPPGALLRA